MVSLYYVLMNKQVLHSVLAVMVIIAIFAGYSFYGNKDEKNEVITEEDIVPETQNETQDNDNQVVPSGNEVVSRIPNLDRPIVVPESTPPAIKEEIINKINGFVALLKQDPDLFNEWLGLGIYRKEIKDYEGARQAWEYASVIRPKNSVSFGNLGVLYGYYLQNGALAEENYLKSIENDPKLPYLYAQTADFYLEVMNNPQKAREILEKGLKAIPGDESLEAMLKVEP